MSNGKYPFEEEWPIEGFPLNNGKGHFVQIRVRKRTDTKWEVLLCFRPYTSEDSVDGPYITLHDKFGRKLKAENQSRCIARFETEAKAKYFTHMLHQAEQNASFFSSFT